MLLAWRCMGLQDGCIRLQAGVEGWMRGVAGEGAESVLHVPLSR